MARTISIPILTDGAGAAVIDRVGLHGRVLAVGVLIGAGGTVLTNTVDITVTDKLTGAAVATFTNVAANELRTPRAIPLTPAGGALATAGPVEAPMLTGGIHIVVAQGGAAKVGSVLVVIE